MIESIRKQDPLHMLPTTDSLQSYTETKKKRIEKDIALMDLESIALDEMCWIEKNKYCMISCGI